MPRPVCIAVLILLSLICGGCVTSSVPEGDGGFADIAGLESLVGCYRNASENTEGRTRYLSSIIWPESSRDPASIDAIQVELAAPSTLLVSTVIQGALGERSRFTEGEDFHRESTKIPAKRARQLSLAYPAGNVFIGLASESRDLGIDREGNLRMLEGGTFAGTAFLVIPVAGKFSEAFRFPRIADRCITGQPQKAP